MQNFDYVILGAGLGGLSAAACLTRQGYRVAVLEQHYLPGGCCHTFSYADYNFCADVHYIYQCGEGQAVKQFLNYIDRDVRFNSLNPDCIDRIITPEVDFSIPLNWEKFRDRLIAAFPEEAWGINYYCNEIKQLYRELKQLTKEVRWYDLDWSDWLYLPKYWHLFTKRNQTLQELFDDAGLSLKLQTLLAGQSGDYGLPPSEIALITHTSLVSDYSEGAYYPQYHFQHLVDSIVAAIVEGGGVVELSTTVQHIEVENYRVAGIYAGGKTYQADNAYISDLDPKLTVKLMHDSLALSKQEYKRLTDYEYSASAFNVYLGLDSSFNPADYGIGNWNIWYYPDGNLNRAYQQQLKGNWQHPWIFLSCPTLKSNQPGIAPAGHHVLEIATVCPYEPFKKLHRTDTQTYRVQKRAVYRQVMNSVRNLIPDIDRYIRLKIFGTPTTSEYFLGQPEGNMYGAKLIPQQIGLNRLGYKTELPNLYLVGATAGYPGVPGVISNGMDVAELLTGVSISKPQLVVSS